MDDTEGTISLAEGPFETETDLIYVYEINRHGARSPTKDFGG